MVLRRSVAASALLDVVKLLLAEPEPAWRLQPPWAARVATTAGFPASAEDDECPRCRIEWGTTWLCGDDVLGLNWWAHDTSYEPGVIPCGLVWPTRIRRPRNGVRIVLVDHTDTQADTRCLYCGDRQVHPDGAAADRWAATHTAMHEGEVSS